MNALRLAFAIVFAACAATGCSDDDDDINTTTTDTGTSVIDTSTEPTDTGSGPIDTGTEPGDTGTASDTGVSDTGAGDTRPGDTSTATKHTVNVGPGNIFSPATLTIKAGDTVEWIWMGDAHTVTESNGGGCVMKSGGFDSGLKNTGGNFSRTFTATGSVNYICTPHCSLGMKGSITVNP